LAASVYQEGRRAQASTEDPEEVKLATTSSATEIAIVVAVPEASATISISVAPVVGLTPARDELSSVPRPVIEKGSGSASAEFFPAGDIMGELARQVVQQFFASMRSCIDLILSGSSSFEFARMFLGNLIENISLAGGPSPARACLLLVEQLGNDLKELKSLEDAGSFHKAQETLTRLLAAQEQERKEMEEQIAEEARHLPHFQADHQKLIGDSKEYELIMQSTEQILINARATIAKTEALIAINERKFTHAKKKLEELEAARTHVKESLSAHSSRLEFLQAQLAAKEFLSEEELWAQALVEAEKARQHEMHRLREQIRSLANQDY